MLSFSCSRCKHNLTRHENEAGSKVACPSCGQRLLVPEQIRAGKDGDLQLDPAEILLHGDSQLTTTPEKAARGVLRFECPHCKSVLKADPAKAGTRANCPKCGKLAEVPVPKGRLLEEREPIIEDLSAHLVPQLPPPEPSRNPYRVEPVRSTPPLTPTPSSSYRHLILLALLLLAGVGVGVFAVSYYRSERAAQEAESLRLKSRIQSLHSQLNALDIEFRAAVSRRDKYRASTLCDQIAHKAELLAEEIDHLVVKLPSGPERDQFVGMAANARLTVAENRATAAQMRTLP
ncbi:MAG: hypothetical protein JNM56_25130 [Planctomycetia bacterium]|nr:hypothetical protein [Planctomycetia bacterium]